MKITLPEFEASLGEVTFPIAVATSGGADSLALLLLTHRWAQQKKGRVIGLTVDHGLRIESKKEALFVQKWAYKEGIEHITLKWEGEKPTSRLQEKAREARYQCLINWCKNNHISTLLLGHHQQDQEETFWLRLSSGSGLDGLSGMKKKSFREGIVLLRPLLKFPKERLKATLLAENHIWIEDPSNQNPRFFRGRLRSFLEKEGLSQIRLFNIMEKLQVDVDFIRNSLQHIIKTSVQLCEGGYLTLQKKSFEELHPALAKRLIPLLMHWFSDMNYSSRATQVTTILGKLKLSFPFTAGGIYWIPQSEKILLLREVSAIKENFNLSHLHKETLWDQRFWIDPEIKKHVPPETYIAPLKAFPLLRKKGDSPIPSSVFPTLPALWTKGEVVSIPHFCYNLTSEVDLQRFFYLKPFFHDSLRFTI